MSVRIHVYEDVLSDSLPHQQPLVLVQKAYCEGTYGESLYVPGRFNSEVNSDLWVQYECPDCDRTFYLSAELKNVELWDEDTQEFSNSVDYELILGEPCERCDQERRDRLAEEAVLCDPDTCDNPLCIHHDAEDFEFTLEHGWCRRPSLP